VEDKVAVALGKVYVVGAGPGDPELITLKGFFLLLSADVVISASLVPRELLDLVREKVVWEGRLTGETHREVVELAVRHAAEGKTVVVLKNGDPTLFGRGVALCREVEARGVPCEIIPGVSSFTAAAAKYKIPITEGGRPLLLTTARSDGDPDVVVFMPEGSAVGLVVEDLYGAGEKVYYGRPRGRPALVFILRRRERDLFLGENRGGYIQEEAQHS
jgi:uroporphyrin-III C-methyltransferase